ncbi:MAG: phenylalanine--tRNA ligase subunit beta [Syntrophomonadaceae bacterium]|nr:phenylalanine--tRNA ligase subunit beta [Syntrophomonadaceae bacterium]
MAVSINWLKKYVDIPWTPRELAHNLTMAGIAIEGVEAINGDSVMELDLTPNRGDCLGMINLAREVAALQHTEVKIPALNIRENQEKIDDYIKVEIADPDLCLRYAARMVKNVQIKPSPEWLQTCLVNSGIRPINNVVDITNFVMLETNQPLHAFDYDLLSEAKKILVRRAVDGEKITTLDEVERTLDQDMLLITDNGRPVALAGIMGGQNTEIGEETVNMLLESACFHGVGVRKTSRKLALRSDSSIRFEKGSDINGLLYALNRAADLIQKLAGGEVVQGICDQYPDPKVPQTITLRPQRVNNLLGINLSNADIKGYIEDLKFPVREDNGNLMVYVPTYRPDIELEADLIEEVARLHGYDKIPASLPAAASRGGLTPYQSFKDKVRELMARTLYEVMNYSFISPRYFDMLGVPEDSLLRTTVKVANPLSEEQSVMRTLLLPGLLETVSRNLARKNNHLAFFEMGTVFFPQDNELPREELKLGAVVAGRQETNWLKQNVEMDFYYLKGILENFLLQLGIENPKFVADAKMPYHPGRCARIIYQGRELGVIGEIHPQVRQNFDIKVRVCGLELDADLLFTLTSPRHMMESITRYPAVERDIAVLLREEIRSDEVVEAIKASGGSLLQKVNLFDVYAGDRVEAGYKSLAYRMLFQSGERTLTEAEVNQFMEGIMTALKEKLDITLR